VCRAWRLHATFDETISRALDVFEKVHQGMPFDGLHWFFGHAESISDHSIEPIAALGGSIAVQPPHGLSGRVFCRALRPRRCRSDAAG
jgi:predicted amidohydrolase YtcJ